MFKWHSCRFSIDLPGHPIPQILSPSQSRQSVKAGVGAYLTEVMLVFIELVVQRYAMRIPDMPFFEKRIFWATKYKRQLTILD